MLRPTMEPALAFLKYRQFWRIGTIALCITTLFLIFLTPREVLIDTTKYFLDSDADTISSNNNVPSETPSSTELASANTYAKIIDKVAVISDTQYTSNLIPLILHYHALLGPSWPILFYTSSSTLQTHLSPSSSAIWNRAVSEGRIEIRVIPEEFNLTSRNGVNLYLSRPWLWEQLAPATHVLVFQADAILCGNARKTMDDFLAEKWDWIAAPLSGSEHLYNGGLSLRNRTKILEILSKPENNWERETIEGSWTMGGEDVWFSRKMDLLGAKLPSFHEALEFACQHEWHISEEKRPAGYHKVHKNIGKEKWPEIERWCPEIALTREGTLEPST